MTYLEMEESAQDADTIHLFLFTRGATNYRYTNVRNDVVALANTWVATPITMSEPVHNNELSKASISIELPLAHAFAQLFLAPAQELRTSLTVFRGYASDPDEEFNAYWKGRVTAAKPNNKTVSIECESIFTSLRRPGLRARYSRLCRHALYGLRCGLDREDFAEAGTCTVATGVNVVIAEAAAFPDGWFVGGILKSPDGTTRHIVKHVGDDIQVNHVPDSLVAAVAISGSEAVTLYPGCDKLSATCKSKYDNLLNNGSFPFIPSKNPMSGSSIV